MSNWNHPDILAMLCGAEPSDIKEDVGHPSDLHGQMDITQSGGFHPDDGEYIIDPDYSEMMGIDDFEDLIKYHK